MIGQYKIITLCTNRIHDKECYEFVGELNRCLCETDMRLFVLNTDINSKDGSFRNNGSSDIHELLSVPGIDVLLVDENRLKSPRTTEKLIKKGHKLGIPVVIIGDYHKGCYNIQFSADSLIQLVDHLIDDHGYTRFHMMAGTRNDPFSDKRINMFKTSLQKHNLPFEDDMVSYGDFWSEPAVEITEKLIADDNLPQAFVCANDNMGIAVIDTLKNHGYRVPEDVAVTGYDGMEEIYYSEPILTTISHNNTALSERLTKLFPDIIDGKITTGTEYVSADLLKHRSCGCNYTTEDASNPSQYITALNNRFNRYLDETIFFAEMGAKIQRCENYEEVCYLMYSDDKLYSTCCLLKKECIDNTVNPNFSLQNGFGEELFLLYDSDRIDYMKLNGERFLPHIISANEVIPELDYYLDNKRFIIFNSLYYLGVPLGYVAFHFSEHVGGNYLKIPQTVTAINNAIGGYRNNRYQHHLRLKINEMYRTDFLTGLLNRWGFAASYEKLLNNLGDQRLTVAMCDLDGLKKINDNYGHEEGDVAIRTAAQTLKKVCPENAICTRFGGDEMLAVFIDEDIDIRERFNAELDSFNCISGKPYNVAGSIGIIHTKVGERPTFEELLKRIDGLMYEEKRRRKEKHNNEF